MQRQWLRADGHQVTPICFPCHSSAVKYADLKNHRTTNYRFSYDDMLSQQVGRCNAECNSSRQG